MHMNCLCTLSPAVGVALLNYDNDFNHDVTSNDLAIGETSPTKEENRKGRLCPVVGQNRIER